MYWNAYSKDHVLWNHLNLPHGLQARYFPWTPAQQMNVLSIRYTHIKPHAHTLIPQFNPSICHLILQMFTVSHVVPHFPYGSPSSPVVSVSSAICPVIPQVFVVSHVVPCGAHRVLWCPYHFPFVLRNHRCL